MSTKLESNQLEDLSIVEAKVAAGAITSGKLATDSVTTVKITDANVTADKLATDSVTTDKIVDSNVTTAKIADDNVTTAKIADGNVTEAKLASGVLVQDYVELVDSKSDGTDGGSSVTGSWQTRDVNTEVADDGGVCALSSNQVTLSAGTYDINVLSPFIIVGGVRIRLYNVSDSSQEIISPSFIVGQTQLYTHNGFAELAGRFTIASSKTFRIEYMCQVATATVGLGADDAITAGAEIYTKVQLWKVS